MIRNLDKRIRLAVGVIFIIGSLFGGLIGYDLRSIGQDYNHIWVLSIMLYMQVLIGFQNHLMTKTN